MENPVECYTAPTWDGNLNGETATLTLNNAVTEVTLTRTEGQTFRERIGFIVLCIIGAYCLMRILVDLKSILEPFLWAIFLVNIWMPVVDGLEARIKTLIDAGCSYLQTNVSVSPPFSAARQMETEGELQPIVRDETHTTAQDDGDDEVHGSMTQGQAATRFFCQDVDGNHSLERQIPDWTSSIARCLAVLVVFALTLGVLVGFGFLVLESARRVRDHWNVYTHGAQNISNEVWRIFGYIFQRVPEGIKVRYEAVTNDVLKTAQDYLYGMLGDLVNSVSSLLLGGMLTLLYTLFWLFSPVPLHSSVDVMFRRYIMVKTLACFGYGVCIGCLLAFLSVDLASVFALTTFAMNFVPEVGSFVAMLLPCPMILLDSRLDRPVLVLISAILGQLALKFAFSNIIEVKLIESDKKLRMHPVMILLSVGIFGHLWGPTGMLLSVPLMALLKLALFADIVPSSYRDPILVLLEGDRNAPLRHGLKAPLIGGLGAHHAPPGG